LVRDGIEKCLRFTQIDEPREAPEASLLLSGLRQRFSKTSDF
jgi:hypothetical protein